MKPLLFVAGLALLLQAVIEAEDLNDQFVRIYNLIQQADALNESGRDDQAREKYLEAQAELRTLRKAHPDWNEAVVGFRLEYVAKKLKSFAREIQPPAQSSPTKEPESPAATGESAGLIQLLREQIRGLRADKDLLQAKLKEALTAQPAAVDPRELVAAQEKIRVLQKEVEVLKVNLEKAEAKPDKPLDPAVLEQTRKSLAGANRKLEQQAEVVGGLTLEKEALQARLQALVSGAEIQSLRSENGVLRARLEAIEARKGPYSAEEQALMKHTEPGGAKATVGAERPSSPGSVPASPAALLAEAARAFSSRRYAEAEEKYSQALRMDENNVAILANLAAVQIEQNRLAQADANLRSALAAAPRDAFSLSLLGILRMRQQKFDEALVALSQAAQLDPNNADLFQRLGFVLAEKGLPEPAESALRRAVQLAPDNSDAHHELAVIYATRKPPATELARWHYQKALATGHPKDRNLEQMLAR